MKKKLWIVVTLFFSILLITEANGYEKELKNIAVKMGRKIADSGKKKLAVFAFKDENFQEKKVGDFLAGKLTELMVQKGKIYDSADLGFQILDKAVTDSLGVNQEHNLTMEELKEIRKKTGVEAVVLGTLKVGEDKIILTVRTVDAESGMVIYSMSVKLANQGKLKGLIGQDEGKKEKKQEKEIVEDSNNDGASEISEDDFPSRIIDKKKIQGFLFELNGCRIGDDERPVCYLTFTNLKKIDYNLDIFIDYNHRYYTELYDMEGKKYMSQEVEAAGKALNLNSLRNLYVQKIPVQVKIYFENKGSNFSKISLLKVCLYGVHDYKQFFVEFKNIPVMK
ncbi:MAG: hypothetical protein A2Y41_03110 [Spirochaetes bacterium GWB1_36_13]|nr:MAG: hypothetical protein A2Y41_03110 [Spirochaetes bacterium GWB1_36_13]